MDHDLYNEPVPVPRGGVRFPLELRPPSGFEPGDGSTWPTISGRLEYVGGRLLLMPPCGDQQQDVAASVAAILETWAERHQEFVVGANEAGMLLGGEIRGADAAVWPSRDAANRTGGFRRTAPLLAVEIAGQEEGEPELREKARWYLDHGVAAVWIVLPDSREIVTISQSEEARYARGAQLPAHPSLPGLEVTVDRVFRQLDL